MTNVEPRAIVIVFQGGEPDVTIATQLVQLIADNCKTPTQDVKVRILDANDLSNLAIKNIISEELEVKPAEDPIADAIVVIGTVMKDYLGSGYRPDIFMKGLIDKMDQAFESDGQTAKAFLNALSLISSFQVTSKDKLLKKWRLDQSKLSIIRTIYNIKGSHG